MSAQAQDKSVAAVRLLQPRRVGAKAKLAAYHDDVLRAAIDAERLAHDTRPMFISMLEAELERRAGEPPKEKPMTTAAPPAAAAASGHHQWIPLAQLSPSPLNHRKHFDKTKMEELADSVRAQGIVVPVLVRPLAEPNRYEIVAGERRFRAAKMASLADLPAIVRELTDAQALELQVIENQQRVDVHPLEEAEGYEALMNCQRADGTPYTAEEIAAKVGKSKAYVYARLKLTALCKKAREAFYDGKLDASRALLIARIPVADLQEQALAEILGGDDEFGDGPMSYREAAEHVQWNYMLRLKEAPFKTTDAALVPAAGACTTCPKRSGNQPELFADVESADVCTDPKCFAAKRDAHLENMRQMALAKGKDVVAARAKGYVKLDDRVKGDWKGRTYRELLGKSAPAPQLMPDASGEKAALIEVVRKADVQETVKKKLEQQKSGNGGGSSRDWERERAESLAFAQRLFVHVVAAIPVKPGLHELRELVEVDLEDISQEAVELTAQLLLPAVKGQRDATARVKQALPKLDLDGLLRLMVVLDLARHVDGHGGADVLVDRAKLYKVDVAGVKAALAAEAKPIVAEDGKGASKKVMKARASEAAEV